MHNSVYDSSVSSESRRSMSPSVRGDTAVEASNEQLRRPPRYPSRLRLSNKAILI